MAEHLAQKENERNLVSLQDERDAVYRLFQSKYFSSAPKKRKFISLICDYYWQGRAAELNEYLIGREVFERGDDYNPAADPIVRVGAHDIRKKLEQYYLKEGIADPVILMIPIGSYVPVFVKPTLINEVAANVASIDNLQNAIIEEVSAPSIETVEPSINITTPSNQKLIWVLTGLVVFLSIVTIVQFLSKRQAVDAPKTDIKGNTLQLGEVWKTFLTNTHPVLFVLSNPIVHKSVNDSDPKVLANKSVTLNKEQSDYLISLAGNRLPTKLDGSVQLIPSANTYTGIGEAIGVFRLTQLLEGSGEETKLKQSRNVSPEDFRDFDVILLGSVYANQWAQPNSIKENFVYGRHATIENLNPQPGEEREYKPVFDEKTGALLEDYALISVTPGASGTNNVMLLAGIYSEGTQGVVEYITDKSGLREMSQKLVSLFGNGNAPKYYQALLKVKVENSYPIKTTLITIRPLTIN